MRGHNVEAFCRAQSFEGRHKTAIVQTWKQWRRIFEPVELPLDCHGHRVMMEKNH